jgi:hypothetical protein|tara:strand:- start:381 stop:764 length:384 start_codon:yes stop_codon:yes gene_type:complete
MFYKDKLMNRLFISLLPLLLLITSTPVKAAPDITELEKLASTSDKLASIARECKTSEDTSSSSCREFIKEFNKGNVNMQIKLFSKNLKQNFSLDKDLALKTLTSIGVISEALTFVFEEKTKEVKGRT